MCLCVLQIFLSWNLVFVKLPFLIASVGDVPLLGGRRRDKQDKGTGLAHAKVNPLLLTPCKRNCCQRRHVTLSLVL